MDNKWTALPITQRMLNSLFHVPYIASVLICELWNRKINHVMRGTYRNIHGQQQQTRSAIRLMPAANSVYIPGPVGVILVLVESTSRLTPFHVAVAGEEVEVFLNRQNIMASDFTQIWRSWFLNANVYNILADTVSALNEVTTYLCAENASCIASALVAELYTTLYLGVGLAANQNQPSYDWDEPAHGAWSLYDDDGLGPEINLKTEFWQPDAADTGPGRRRVVGYNFSALSCWHLPST